MIAIGMSMISFFAYQPYLFKTELFPMPILAIGVLILIIMIARHIFLLQLAGGLEKPKDPQPEPAQTN